MESVRVRAASPSPADAEHLLWLARVNEDTQSVSTPLSAFLAALPRLQQRHPRTSAERGKAFRERQRLYEEELEKAVGRLRKEVTSLEMRCKVRETRCLNTPASQTGSFVQLIREYHRLFRNGLLDLPQTRQPGQKRPHVDDHIVKKVSLQEEFIRCVIDANAIVGSQTGPKASIIQWRRYTQSHACMTAEVSSAEATSVDDDLGTVAVTAHCSLRVRLSRETFKLMFPHLLHDEAFLQKMIGKAITYSSTKHFQFTNKGRIIAETVDVDFVGGFLNAGFSLNEITKLFERAAITKDSMIVKADDSIEAPDSETAPAFDISSSQSSSDASVTPSPTTSTPASPSISETPSDSSKRLSMAFILSDSSGA